MEIKICGMREPENIQRISHLAPDYMGFIFYEKSKRFVGHNPAPEIFCLPSPIKSVGVFVNAKGYKIEEKVHLYNLKALQLHGNETPQYCRQLRKNLPNCEIIKTFGIEENLELERIHSYIPHCHRFLFDTKTSLYGGTGRIFPWETLLTYNLAIPFFLAGGIGLQNIKDAAKFSNQIPSMKGIDVNSQAEIKPGIKSLDIVKKIIQEIKK